MYNNKSMKINVIVIGLIIGPVLLQIYYYSNGRFQKISIPIPRTAFGISEGEWGSLNWNSEGMGGIYNWKSEGMGGGFTGGISRVEGVE